MGHCLQVSALSALLNTCIALRWAACAFSKRNASSSPHAIVAPRRLQSPWFDTRFRGRAAVRRTLTCLTCRKSKLKLQLSESPPKAPYGRVIEPLEPTFLTLRPCISRTRSTGTRCSDLRGSGEHLAATRGALSCSVLLIRPPGLVWGSVAPCSFSRGSHMCGGLRCVSHTFTSDEDVWMMHGRFHGASRRVHRPPAAPEQTTPEAAT